MVMVYQKLNTCILSRMQVNLFLIYTAQVNYILYFRSVLAFFMVEMFFFTFLVEFETFEINFSTVLSSQIIFFSIFFPNQNFCIKKKIYRYLYIWVLKKSAFAFVVSTKSNFYFIFVAQHFVCFYRGKIFYKKRSFRPAI